MVTAKTCHYWCLQLAQRDSWPAAITLFWECGNGQREIFFYLVAVTVKNNYRILLPCKSRQNFSDLPSESVENKYHNVNPYFIPRERLNSAAASHLMYYMQSASKKEAVSKLMCWKWEALMYINSYFPIYHRTVNL